jgi:hypothetical protein
MKKPKDCEGSIYGHKPGKCGCFEFRCPVCGSISRWGSDIAWGEMWGRCNGNGCRFKWRRSEDAKYFHLRKRA